ncbi:hypothetical protein pipiens_011049 [Culex pipiens pipiens]|uniref:Peptidase M12B propeptide domain-containing protein n=1 Tax=Culex pipiens pipiens TaxID=38569 RepID=A0ABD1D7V4_CULPP
MRDDSNNIGRPLDGDSPASGNGTQPRAGFPVDDEIPRLHDPDKAEIAFIKPKKILGKPLHATDVLYEGKIIDTDGTGGQHAPKSHWTGLFRNRSSRIWDPNPEYDIDAFGLSMRINLFHDRGVMADGLKETHVWPNKTLRKQDDSEDAGGQGCYYKGHVENDEKSLVVVSLCDGIMWIKYILSLIED